jgi:hypothetical protein
MAATAKTVLGAISGALASMARRMLSAVSFTPDGSVKIGGDLPAEEAGKSPGASNLARCL